MIRECVKSKSFKIYNITNNCKLELLKQRGINILEYKQFISKETSKNFYNFLSMSKFDFITKYNSMNPKTITGQEAQKALEDVFDCYSNKKDKLISRIKFKLQTGTKIEKYKNNTKYGKKGEIKNCSVVLEETKLTKICTYLARYYNDNLLEYINTQLQSEEVKKNKKEFYKEVIYYLNRYGEKIINIALYKRNNLLQRIAKQPIEFRSKTYRSMNRIKVNIIEKNKNLDSIFNAYINLGGFGETLEIPTKYSKKYHGNLNLYNKNRKNNKIKNISYTIVFNGNVPERLVLTIDGEEEITVGKINYVGVDANVKHNLFYTSTNHQIDYDRNMVKEYCEFIKRIDETQKRKKKFTGKRQPISNKNLRNWKVWRNRLKSDMKRKVRELLDLMKYNGKDHLVIENLGNFAKTFVNSEEFEGIKYSRLVRLLNLSDLKNIIQSMANKSGMQVTFVQPEYSSKACPWCGNIDSNNRKTQEEFICTECGRHANADYVSSLNLEGRMSSDVLRTSLLDKKDFGYIPKKLSKDKIREIIQKNPVLTHKDELVEAIL